MGDVVPFTANPDVAALATQGLPPQQQAAIKAQQAEIDAAAAVTRANEARRQAIMDKLIKTPEVPAPNLQNVEQSPPITPTIEPVRAFQNWGVALALLGSLATRAPLTAAFRVGAEAMGSYTKGQVRDYMLKRQQWKDEVSKAIQNNQNEIERYRAALDRRAGDFSLASAELQGIAADTRDEVSLAMMRAGQWGDLEKLWQHREDIAASYARSIALAHLRYGPHGGALTRAQVMHDQKVLAARQRLKSVYQMNYEDQKDFDKINQAVTDGSGFVDPITRDKWNLWKTANDPLYSDLYNQEQPSLDSTDVVHDADTATALAQAKNALANGADRGAVDAQLKSMGIDPSLLDQADDSGVATSGIPTLRPSGSQPPTLDTTVNPMAPPPYTPPSGFKGSGGSLGQ